MFPAPTPTHRHQDVDSERLPAVGHRAVRTQEGARACAGAPIRQPPLILLVDFRGTICM